MRVTIKWRFLLKFAAVMTVAFVVVALVHRRQVRDQVGAFLRQADLAKEAAASASAAGNEKTAAAERGREESFLRRFLLNRPDDVDVRERLGRLMVQNAKSRRQLRDAHLALEEVLRRDPSRDELRRFVIDLTLDPRVGLIKEAQGHVETLLKKKPTDGELNGLLARCLVREKKFVDAELAFIASVADRSDRSDLIESHLGLAFVRRAELKKEKEADQAIVDMLKAKANQGKFRALLGAVAYLRNFNLSELAGTGDLPVTKDNKGRVTRDTLVDDARRIAPDELDVLLTAATVTRDRARWRSLDQRDEAIAEARRLLTRAVELHPRQPLTHLALAELEAEAGRPADALAAVQKGLAALPESAELLFGKLDYQIRAGDGGGAAETLAALKSAGLSADVAELQRIRILVLKDEWKDVAPALERLIPELQDNPSQLRQANILLGRCYEQLGQPQKRLAAYQAVLNRPSLLAPGEPLWGEATVGVARAQAELGQTDQALAAYDLMWNAGYPGAFVPIAWMELIRALRTPVEKRDWGATEKALQAAEKAVADNRLPDATEVRILRAALTHHQGKQPGEARKQLEALAAERPKDVAVRTELVMQHAREDNLPNALAALGVAERDLGDLPDLRLTRANLWATAGRTDLATKLVELAAGAEKFGPAGQRRLLRGLAEIASQRGADEAAGRLWDDLAAAAPFDLGVQLVRFDRASRAGDAAAMGKILEQIVRNDGENGQVARLARATLLVKQAQDAKDPALRKQALELLNGLEREQVGPPLNGRVALGQALIHDADGNADAAIEKYDRAVGLGEMNPNTLRRFLELLDSRGRAGEAEERFKKLPPKITKAPDFQWLAAGLSLNLGKWEDAIEHALRAIPKNSPDPKNQLALGRLYWMASRRPEAKPGVRKEAEREAEAHFREAVRLKPDAAEGWLALVECLAATDRKDEAAKTFEQARENVGKADRALFTSRGYILLGERDKAVKAYEQARTENPNDVAAAAGEADYLLSLGHLAAAREGYRRVMAMPSASADVKAAALRNLAITVAADPDYQTSRQALELLAGTPLGPPTGNETAAQRRGRAVILALQKDRESKLEAIRLLAETTEGRTPGEQFLLAQLYNQVGDRRQVRVVLADLLKTEKNRTPLYVGFFAGWLLREGDPGAAAEWVGVLEKLDKDSLGTAELKARVAMKKTPPDLAGARAALVTKADAPGAPVGRIARVCEDIGLYDDAERLLKRFVEENKAKEPQVVLALATYYGRRPGGTADALRVWEEAKSKLPADFAPALGGAAVDILSHTAHPVPDALAGGVARWLEETAGKSQDKTRALFQQQLASVRNMEGKFDASAELYRQAIVANPRDALARNNLAFLRSLKDKQHDEALGLVEEARKVMGHHPELLDTEALIRLEKGEVAAAIKLLEVVVAEAPSGAAYFRLARAYEKAKNVPEARRAWDRAVKDLGLKAADLHPLERPDYDDLPTKLKQLK